MYNSNACDVPLYDATLYPTMEAAKLALEDLTDGEIVEYSSVVAPAMNEETPIVWTITDRVHYAQHNGIKLRLTPHAIGLGYTAAVYREHWLCEQEFADLALAKKVTEAFARKKWG